MPVPDLIQADNGKWYIHWTEGRRSRRLSTRQTDLASAKVFYGTWLLTEHEGAVAPAQVYTVADLWTVYDERHIQKHVARPEPMKYVWANLCPHFGELPIAGVTQDVVEDYERKRAAGKIGQPSAPPTIRRELSFLRACFNWCADPKRRLIDKAAVPAFALPEAGQPRDRWLRIPEIQRLLTAAAALRAGARLSRGERFLWLALETAARKTAILELTWDRVDFETGVIHYNVEGRRRTKKRRADVPISNALRPVLVRAYAERTGPLVMDNSAEIWAAIQIIAERAGFGDPDRAKRRDGDKPKGTGISPHVFRHTAATQMARRGVPLWTIAGVLGNTLAVVEAVYAKHAPEGLADAVELISGGMLEAAE